MSQRPFELPSWAPVAALAAIVVWAVSIWWMVANLDTGADPGLREGVTTLRTDMEALASRLEALTTEVDGLREERAALMGRVADLEAGALVASVATEEPAEEAHDDALDAHPLFTDGADRFNCRHFTSYEEAQEALRVNGPGDPNRIDTNNNGKACEDFKYATATAPSTAAPAASTSASTTPGAGQAQQGIAAR